MVGTIEVCVWTRVVITGKLLIAVETTVAGTGLILVVVDGKNTVDVISLIAVVTEGK